MITETLNCDESTLIDGLRDIPPGAAYDELIGIIQDLIAFVRDPRCPLAQADGLPCDSIEAACGECRDVPGLLALIHRGLPI
jgi:hypothetical protein